jgi:hypothetical protein
MAESREVDRLNVLRHAPGHRRAVEALAARPAAGGRAHRARLTLSEAPS